MYRKDCFEYNNSGLSFQSEDLLIEREQLKIKKAQWEDLLIEREQLKIKKAQ